jgi:hypothetical protein
MPSLRAIAHDGWWLRTFTTYITAAGNSLSSQLDSFYQDNRYSMEKAGCTACPSHTKSLSSSQPGGPPYWTSPLKGAQARDIQEQVFFTQIRPVRVDDLGTGEKMTFLKLEPLFEGFHYESYEAFALHALNNQKILR